MLTEKLETEAKDIFSSDLEDKESIDSDKYHNDPTYFPDGGLRAWLQVVGGFFAVFVTWGLVTSFGAFQSYYKQELLPGVSAFKMGWISSIQSAFLLLGGTLSGRLFDIGYFYHLITFSTVLTFFSFMMVAQCSEFYQLLLAQGFGIGLGMGTLFGPCISCASTYFKKRRLMVISIMTSGGGLGGTIFPIAANNMLKRIGFQWSIRVLAFIDLFCLLLILTFMRDRLSREVRKEIRKKSKGKFFALESWFDYSALRDPTFILFVVGITACFFGVLAPYAYLQSFTIHINASKTIVTYIIPFLGCASFFGRLSTFLMARIMGPLTSTSFITLCCVILLFSWISITSEASVVLFALFYGFFSGAVGSLPPFIIPELTTDITRLGVRYGMCFLSMGSFMLLSIPLAGLVMGPNGDNYHMLAVFCGVPMAFGCVVLFLSRLSRSGFKLVRV
ncbi:similar to Saccharomyces cerevisiae YOL119C MCH4 Protein with similarity to mammalian monocarboxylate permeases [Geotrichum candidum]|uniref:Similar to Saccharomyces cerevisiae YOL119C MCH4 Protein with similarity to mammalian monocarboxylate permeases n=1 Tax=Geotrichum candidum TaxID=1173061 RepID=A0A0J9X8E0_GEOCN|nr:similar to Saccharomyces cerevisiae YOL119C MCH4 Protein with similarity to mammalian monocarboxylate permeases [Geotrichum candidum]